MSILLAPVEVPSWMLQAERWLGQHEIAGAQDNVFIVESLRRVGILHAHDEVAWCAAFANRVLSDAGLPSTGSAAARSFLQYGTELDAPVFGCVQVFERVDPQNPGAAHVNFHVGRLATHLFGLGGNQANAVNVDFRTAEKLIGLRWPPGVPLPA